MNTTEKPDTHQKALSINLNGTIFGSFAEIGAGQEVARWFLTVGGASGTVAKTISAYDKEVSDDLYGAGTRYVSKPRLKAMLDSEWEQLLGQLQASRGTTTKFFAFVDTVSARNFSGTNDCHGWIGLRFLMEPGGAPQQIVLHVNLRDPSNLQQQDAVGVLGVNLLYAVHHALGSMEEFLASLFDGLSLERLELDCVELSGGAFDGWNPPELHAYLVAAGYAEGVAFLVEGETVPASELLYKRAVVLAPGRVDIEEDFQVDLIAETLAQLPPEELSESKGGLGLFCVATKLPNVERTEVPAKIIVEHVKKLQRRGYGAMVFREPELYVISAFVSRYTKSRIHFAIGLSMLVRVFEDRYKDLAGNVLEGLSRLFRQNVRLSVYPMAVEDVERHAKVSGLTGWKWNATDGVVFADDLHPAEPLDFLYRYLLGTGCMLPAGREKRATA